MLDKTLNILLADDDKDDRFFFKMALDALSTPTELVAVVDGEKLMDYLTENVHQLPDVLFLDLNMPRKNGFECLSEIKLNPDLHALRVIIFSPLMSKKWSICYTSMAHNILCVNPPNSRNLNELFNKPSR